MTISGARRPTWRKTLDMGELILSLAAHDALTAKLIERAGFRAFRVGAMPRSELGLACPTSTSRNLASCRRPCARCSRHRASP